MTIPKIIHQTWETDSLPEDLKQFSNSWKQHHPDWDYNLWTDDDNRTFIKKKYPGFLRYYDSLPFAIQRADIARYFILHSLGGVYVDLDIKCLQPIQSLLSGEDCVLALEPPEHCKIHHTKKIIGNAFIAAQSGHSFIQSLVLDQIIHQPQNIKNKHDFVLKKTGPLMVTRVYDKFSGRSKIKLVPYKYIYPLSYTEADLYLNKKRDYPEKLKDAYTIHYFFGTWWKNGE